MEKFPLTTDGFAGLFEMLYSLDDSQLEAEAEGAVADTCGWIAKHFELQVYQLEFLRSLKRSFTNNLGYCIGLAMNVRRPVRLINIAGDSGSVSCSEACLLLKITITSHFANGELVSTGEVAVQLGNM
jgi:hypothetical protein